MSLLSVFIVFILIIPFAYLLGGAIKDRLESAIPHEFRCHHCDETWFDVSDEESMVQECPSCGTVIQSMDTLQLENE